MRGGEPDGLAAYSGRDAAALRATPACARGDISNIYYTSGTTGMPKGCTVDHEWWLRTVDVLLRRVPQTPSDRVLCCLQFFYSDPGHLLLECLTTGGALVVMRRFSVSRFWDVVRDHRVTLILSFSSIPLFLLKAPADPRDRDNHVRVARHLAMPPDLHRQVVERWGFPWIEGYGITEGNVVTSMPLEYADEMTGSGSIGIPVPEVDCGWPATTARTSPAGATGEVVMRGPGMFRGYLNRPEATQEAMADGWLRTGDLGRQDERGFLYFMGRKKDIIRRSGKNLTASGGGGRAARSPDDPGRGGDPGPRPGARRGGQGVRAAGRRQDRGRPARREDRRVLRRPPGLVQGAALHRVPGRRLPADALDAGPQGGAQGRARRPDRGLLGP